jgi:hypothetical protein
MRIPRRVLGAIGTITPTDGNTAFGRKWGTPVGSIPCHIESTSKLVTDPATGETAAASLFAIFEPDVDLAIGYKLTYAGQDYLCAESLPLVGHHIEAYFTRWSG